jgi:hypothetical protein
MKKRLPSQKYLLNRFKYYPKTGNLCWKKKKLRSGYYHRYDKTWNTRYAGTIVGTPNSEGRREVELDYQNRQVACIIFKMLYNKEPPEVEHKDGNPGNNKEKNLRSANHRKNMHNQKLRRDNTSGIKGIRLFNRNTLWFWRGEIEYKGKTFYTKQFNLEKYYKPKRLVIKAMKKLRNKLHGEFANHG